MSAQNNSANAGSQKIRLEYLDSTARYSSQAIINSSGDDIFIDFSSGKIPAPEAGHSVLPIHTRIAMSPAGAKRLVAALQQSLNRVEVSKKQPTPPSDTSFPHLD